MNSTSLSPLLDFVLSHRPALETLIEDREGLQKLANLLPPLPCAGLELRLASGTAAVTDLQIGLCGVTDLYRLHEWFEQSWLLNLNPLPDDWAALRRALSSWINQIPMHELWLELDGGGNLPWPSLSLFIGLSTETSVQQVETQLLKWLESLNARPNPLVVACLQRCLAACKPPQRLTHLGYMPGRSGSSIRLIVDGCTWETDTEFLKRAGWTGDPDDWRNTLLPLQTNIDRWRLAISLHEDGSIDPVVGLECFVGQPTAHDPRWMWLMQQGNKTGWWSNAAVDALLTWPGPLDPVTSRSDWPDSLILDTVIDGDVPPASLNLRISHLKLLCDGRSLWGAKGYVGFARVRPDASGKISNHVSLPKKQSSSLSEALNSGLGFLLMSRTSSGWWQDYDGFNEGASDEWVSAFIASAILASGLPAGVAAVSRTWSLLEARGRHGWGWNAMQPPDADSTVWALRLALALGHDREEIVQQALSFVADHVIPNGGGVTTYEKRHHAAAGGSPGCQPGWFEPHGCVTAVTAYLATQGGQTRLRNTVDYLQQNQGENGAWSAYWWHDSAYATAFATEALVGDSDPASLNACIRAADWARISLTQNSVDDFSPFALALRMQILAHALVATDTTLLKAGYRKLLAVQLDDGSWPASAALTIPNRDGDVIPALDNRRTMTTALIVQTLARLQELGLQ